MERNFEICKILSREVYNDNVPSEINGWNILPSQELHGRITTDKTGKKVKINVYKRVDFACVAYKKGNEIIIAYRGTDGVLDIITDTNFVAKKIPPSTILAKKFYLKVKKENPDCEIWLTGHSLGGAYAQIVSARSIRDSNLCRAITFNAPGFGYALKKKEKEKHRKNLLERINNYVIMNDFVGNFREHAGSTYYIQPYPLCVPKSDNPKENHTPHGCITNYCLEEFGPHFSCPKDWNSKHAWALWVFDVNKVSVAEKALRKVLDAKVNGNDLKKAIEIIKDLQTKGKLKLLNAFKFEAFRKKYTLLPNV